MRRASGWQPQQKFQPETDGRKYSYYFPRGELGDAKIDVVFPAGRRRSNAFITFSQREFGRPKSFTYFPQGGTGRRYHACRLPRRKLEDSEGIFGYQFPRGEAQEDNSGVIVAVDWVRGLLRRDVQHAQGRMASFVYIGLIVCVSTVRMLAERWVTLIVCNSVVAFIPIHGLQIQRTRERNPLYQYPGKHKYHED